MLSQRKLSEIMFENVPKRNNHSQDEKYISWPVVGVPCKIPLEKGQTKLPEMHLILRNTFIMYL